MTTIETMYAPQVNSPATTLSANISSSATSISVLSGATLPAAPNLLVIGGDTENAETVRMTAKSGNTLTVVRGVQGTARAWNSGATIARLFTAKDLADVQTNITNLDSGKAEKTDLNAANDRIDEVYANSASGSIATFERITGGMPVNSLEVAITPKQAGSGDPSPTNVRAISGWTAANVRRTDGCVWGGEQMADDMVAAVNNSSYCTKGTDTDGKYVSLVGNVAINNAVLFKAPFQAQYTLIVKVKKANAAAALNLWLRYTDGTYTNIQLPSAPTANTVYTVAFTSQSGKLLDRVESVYASGTAYFYYEDCGLFEGTLTASDFTPYQGVSKNISFGQTVYGGKLDVTTGELTVTHGYIGSYAGETLPGKWICDRAVYVAGTTPPTGAQVVYELATPTTYQLTPVEVTTLLGENNIWADTGDVEVTFGEDIKQYIDETAAGFQDEITASGILKGDGAGGISAAVAGTDYQAPLTAGTDYQTPLDEKALQWYGVCSTSASTQAKTVSITGITALTEGLEIRVKMTNAQTYNGTPTLNVNSLGAKTIKQHGSTDAVRYQWQAGEVISFTYDGTYWVIENNSLATTTYFGLTRLNSATNSTAEDCAATPKAVKTAYDLADAAIPATEKGTNVATLATAADSTTPSVPRITPAQSFAPIFDITADTTLAAKHAGGILKCTNSPTITIPANVFAEATQIEILNYGTGVVTVQGASGCSLNGTSAGSKQITDQYSSGVLLAISASQWVIQGAIS